MTHLHLDRRSTQCVGLKIHPVKRSMRKSSSPTTLPRLLKLHKMERASHSKQQLYIAPIENNPAAGDPVRQTRGEI